MSVNNRNLLAREALQRALDEEGDSGFEIKRPKTDPHIPKIRDKVLRDLQEVLYEYKVLSGRVRPDPASPLKVVGFCDSREPRTGVSPSGLVAYHEHEYKQLVDECKRVTTLYFQELVQHALPDQDIRVLICRVNKGSAIATHYMTEIQHTRSHLSPLYKKIVKFLERRKLPALYADGSFVKTMKR